MGPNSFIIWLTSSRAILIINTQYPFIIPVNVMRAWGDSKPTGEDITKHGVEWKLLDSTGGFSGKLCDNIEFKCDGDTISWYWVEEGVATLLQVESADYRDTYPNYYRFTKQYYAPMFGANAGTRRFISKDVRNGNSVLILDRELQTLRYVEL